MFFVVGSSLPAQLWGAVHESAMQAQSVDRALTLIHPYIWTFHYIKHPFYYGINFAQLLSLPIISLHVCVMFLN